VWQLYFKASDGSPAAPLRGVGHATSKDGVSWTFSADPVVDVQGFGFPKVLHYEAPGEDTTPVWLMWLTTDKPGGDLIGATATDPGGPWELNTTPQIDNSATPFDYLFNPAPTCAANDPGSPIKLLIGGAYQDRPGVGIARFHVSSGFRWSPDSPFMESPNDTDLRQWDAVALDDGSSLLYYVRKEGINRVFLAHISDDVADLDFEWAPAEWRNGQCLLGTDPDPCENGVSDECCSDQPEFEGCSCFTDPGSQACCADDPESAGCACLLDPGSLQCCAEDPTADGCACLLDPGSEACCDENPDFATCAPVGKGGCNCQSSSTNVAFYPLLAGMFVLGFRRRRR